MGVWGITQFENDDALDFLAGVLKQEDDVRSALIFVLELPVDFYLQRADASMALAAAEFVAASNGNPSKDFPEDAKKWVSLHLNEVNGLRDIAIRATGRILEKSELKDLWEESDEFSKWQDSVKELIDRLLR